jgi:2-keto-3-deoxy-L-rhamnonate aldolase RhmA
MTTMTQVRRSMFRAAVRSAQPALGTWVKLPAMESVELVALAGFDFVVIDLEHSAMSTESAYRQIGVAALSGVSPIVRVPNLDAGLVGRLLDAGAEGIMLPHVDTVRQAEEAVSAMRFPPLGRRGMGPTGRAGGWGALSREEYVRFAQEEVVLIAQIESAAAARDAGAIAAVPGVDALLIGAADLCMSEQRQESDPVITSLIAEAVQDTRAQGKPIGNSGPATAAAVRSAADAGFSFTLMSNDASLLGAAAASAVAAGRSQTRKPRTTPIHDREPEKEHA